VLFLGNGGSAADAQHLAAELVGRYVRERRPLPGLALTVDTSALTSIGNDYGFDQVFARQLEALGSPGDVVVAITTSGTSPNVLAALTVARQKGIAVIGFTGKRGEEFAKLCDVAIVVPSRETSRVQEGHITVGHILCEVIDVGLLRASLPPPAAREEEKLVSKSAKEVALPTLIAMRAAWKAGGLTVV
jgi:D-sedoheptulose 7-phosphate isomerase